MKAKITSKTYYIAETEDGKKYSVDIRNPQIKFAFDNNLEIEGEIYREEKQDRYTNGEYARSYTVVEKFVPKKDKITISDEKPKIKDIVKEFSKTQPDHIPLPKKEDK
jgi:hypothetical protein